MTTIVDRVKNILFSPRSEWQVIEAETGTIGEVYARYVVILAAIPAIASFIGLALIGTSMFGVSFKMPIGSALASAVIGYLMALAMTYVLSLIANALAPTFGGQKNHFYAFKLIAYAYTASFVAGIFMLIPSLSLLTLLGALYSLYLLYVGLPIMMKHPQERNLGYFLVLFLCGLVASIVVASVSSCLTPSAKLRTSEAIKIDTPIGKVQIEGKEATKGTGQVTIAGPGGAEVKIHSQGGKDGTVSISAPGANIELDAKKLEEFAKKMEEAGKKMEEASKSGDPAAALKALQEALKNQQAPAK